MASTCETRLRAAQEDDSKYQSPAGEFLRGTPHAFVRKPFTPDALLHQVRTLIGGADGPNSDVSADVDLAS
jgi:hypothetical protein